MRYLSGTFAAALIAALAVTSASELGAAPLFVPKAATAQSDVVQVRDGVIWRRNQWGGNNYRRGGNYYGNNFRRGGNYYGNNFRRQGNYGWYNGHRGYPYRRPGYRYYNGFWFPGGAFIAGAIIGGAIANGGYYDGGVGPRYYLDGNPGGGHVQWCYNRYRSYRAWDNTFQPYHGPRRQCYSPYD
jgi:hypothetical protein